MDFVFNPYSISLIFFGGVSLFLSFYILMNEKGALRCIGLMLISNAIWATGYGLELASTTLQQMKWLVNMEYLGIVSYPVNWFLFCLELGGKENWLSRRSNLLLLGIIPVVTLLLVWTNDYHHLHYISLSADYSGPFPLLKIERGLSFYLFTCYFYGLLLIGNYILVSKFRKSDTIYRKQNTVILMTALLPWIVNCFHISGLDPIPNLDSTPFTFMLSALLLLGAIYRYKLFDVLPVAREKVLELMQDGFILLDHRHRVIDYNTAFTRYMPATFSGKVIGERIENLLVNQPCLLDMLKNHQSGKTELAVPGAAGVFDLEADIRFMDENILSRDAIIIKFQDLTRLRQEALLSKQQAEELQRLNQLKDRIFSIMAHDLRGPLLNLSEVLKMTGDNTISPEEFKVLSPSLLKDINYTTDLLDNILHWSRSQLKGYGLHRENFSLHDMISAEVAYHLKSATLKSVNITYQVPEELQAYADLLMMQIVIRNLIANAIKFCSAGCLIEITATRLDDFFTILTIQDNGVGISEENIEKILRGENISSRGTQNEKGTGIGLMVCLDFMDRNGGSFSVESRPGRGTVCRLKIPSEQQK